MSTTHLEAATHGRGTTLVECLVAIALLTLGGTTVLATVLTAERLAGRAARAAATDRARLEAVRGVELAPACRTAPTPDTLTLLLPATPERASLTATVRCGP